MALKIKIKKNTLVRKIDGVKKTGYYGNAIVPQVMYEIFRAIEQVECPPPAL